MKIYLLLLLVVMSGCHRTLTLPKEVMKTDKPLTIYPDYAGLTVPPNIAPLNFQVKGGWEDVILHIEGDKLDTLLQADHEGNILFEETTWHEWLQANRGKELRYTLYTCKDKSWTQYPAFVNKVAPEEIDPYLCYRLIEPGYQVYGQMGIYQRSLASFEEQTIYETKGDRNDHCINCHTFQNGETDKMLFHIRNHYSGMLVVNGDEITKVNTKVDSLWGATVYPAWHPTLNKVAFSINKTGQLFHLVGPEKIEVIDEASGLVLYDVDKRVISIIRDEENVFENNPTWNPEGDTLYYTAATVDFQMMRDSTLPAHYTDLRYDIMYMPYDKEKNVFGTPDTLFPASKINKSVSFPRISPDGRYLLFAMADYGQFHIWHKSSDLYILDFNDKTIRPLDKANSQDVESYHAWSSNGRWIVFSTRRDDGSFTRPYFSYIDSEGKETKAFILPVEKPEYHLLNSRSYNVPEFTRQPITISKNKIEQGVREQQALPADYLSLPY